MDRRGDRDPSGCCAGCEWVELYLEGALTRKHPVLLALPFAGQPTVSRTQEHIDEDVVQVCRGARDPLANDEQAQVAEQAVQEDDLGHKLTPHGQGVPEVALVEPGHGNPKVHLYHA